MVSHNSIPVGNTGLSLNTTQLTTAAGQVENEVVVVGDPTDPLGQANVIDAQPSADAYAMVVRPILPLTGFGEVRVANKTPQVQVKFPNGINTAVVEALTNKVGSTVTAVDGLCTITAAAVAESFSQARTLDVIRYGPGQGLSCLYTATFTAGLANSSLWAGAGDDDEMLAFGYDETSFGILHRSFGELEFRDLTFTAGGDAGGGTFTLTIDDTPITITVPPGSATIAEVCSLVVAAAADLFNAGRGWEVHTDDSITVTFTSLVAENAAGVFSFVDVDSGVTAGTFNQATTELAGIEPNEDVIAQVDWNIDPMDGTGPSGMTLDPTKLNVFSITFQYLGAGNLFFGVENPLTGISQPVHMLRTAGTRVIPIFRQATFHMTAIAKTEVGFVGAAPVITTSSFGGFIEGVEAEFGVRHDFTATVATNGTTEVVNLVMHSEETFNGTRNKIEAFLDHLTLINEATKPIKIELYRNPTQIDDGVVLSPVSENSIMHAGAGSGTRTGGDKLLTVSLSGSESKDLNIQHLRLKMRPTEQLAVVVTKLSGGADGDVTVGVSWVERI